MDDLIRLIDMLNGTLKALPQVIEGCSFIDNEELAKKQGDIINKTICGICSNIKTATEIVLLSHQHMTGEPVSKISK